MKNLNRVLDEIFGPMSCDEKGIIIEAVKNDNKNYEPGDSATILNTLNEVFGKSHRVMSVKVINKYKQILKVYSMEEIKGAFEKARDDDYHRDTGYKFCTPEYFSRIEQLDKWVSYVPKATKSKPFQMPRMNLKDE
jgi:hypothetical protein